MHRSRNFDFRPHTTLISVLKRHVLNPNEMRVEDSSNNDWYELLRYSPCDVSRSAGTKPSRCSDHAAAATRLRKASSTRFVCPYKRSQKLSFVSARKCWNCSAMAAMFAMGVRPPFEYWILRTEDYVDRSTRALAPSMRTTAAPVGMEWRELPRAARASRCAQSTGFPPPLHFPWLPAGCRVDVWVLRQANAGGSVCPSCTRFHPRFLSSL
jgi:hypothetical protein